MQVAGESAEAKTKSQSKKNLSIRRLCLGLKFMQGVEDKNETALRLRQRVNERMEREQNRVDCFFLFAGI